MKNIFSVFDFLIKMSYDIDFYMSKHLFERVQKVPNTIWPYFSIWGHPCSLKAPKAIFGQNLYFSNFSFKYRKSSQKCLRWPYKYQNLIKDTPNDFPTHYHDRFFRKKSWIFFTFFKKSLRFSLRIFTCIRKSLRKLWAEKMRWFFSAIS